MSVDAANGEHLNANIVVYNFTDVVIDDIDRLRKERRVNNTIGRRLVHKAHLPLPGHRPPVIDGVAQELGQAASTKQRQALALGNGIVLVLVVTPHSIAIGRDAIASL